MEKALQKERGRTQKARDKKKALIEDLKDSERKAKQTAAELQEEVADFEKKKNSYRIISDRMWGRMAPGTKGGEILGSQLTYL